MRRNTIQAEVAGASAAGGLFIGGVPLAGLAFGLGLGIVLALALRPSTTPAA